MYLTQHSSCFYDHRRLLPLISDRHNLHPLNKRIVWTVSFPIPELTAFVVFVFSFSTSIHGARKHFYNRVCLLHLYMCTCGNFAIKFCEKNPYTDTKNTNNKKENNFPLITSLFYLFADHSTKTKKF